MTCRQTGNLQVEAAIASASENFGEDKMIDIQPLSLRRYYVDVDDTLDEAGTEFME